MLSKVQIPSPISYLGLDLIDPMSSLIAIAVIMHVECGNRGMVDAKDNQVSIPEQGGKIRGFDGKKSM